MENEKTSAEASIIRALWVVFGYSFVGFISLLYGISLQHFNMKEQFTYMLSSSIQFRRTYLIIVIIIILYNLLFCHAYASLYAENTNTDKILYPKLGHWLETILLIVIMGYFIPLLVSGNNRQNTLFIVISISIPWCTSIIIYRTFLIYCKNRNYIKPNRTKYRLIIPSFLLVAINIYSGASIYEMWCGLMQYSITFFFLSIFVVLYCLIEFIDYKKNKDENSVICLDKKLPYVYYIMLIIFSIICIYKNHYQHIDLLYIPMRTLFAASFVAIYLSMFEGWFLIRKETNTLLEERTQQILTLMPMFVFILFPFQQFQLIFWIAFVVGHLIAWIYKASYSGQVEKNLFKWQL